ncbi:enoyl-CoA hydratase/isomerase family protein [Jatrophihabitans sp.]|uniref:enoyl-CoA hydratase/isomerase family protein n=1 Tax=Jatrophihabitans sp. TaxID=1932789 RepID=UPI0030C687E8|nr:enoyl-CoA hydratase [Jatrophihabitans sp.]
MLDPSTYGTIQYAAAEHVVTVTLNRPERLNAFNQQMLEEFADVWQRVRLDDDVHVVVVRAAGDRAFCTGVDVQEGFEQPANLWSQEDPGAALGPRSNRVWKPVICAVHGMVAGGAFYWLNESDIIIGADDATFFDPHVSYGMTSSLEPIGLARRIPIGEVLRWALIGLDERMSAQRALQIGLVSELVPYDQLWARADELAKIVAAKPPAATQGTVRAIWESLDLPRTVAQQTGLAYTQIGNPLGTAEVSRTGFTKPKWTLR